MDQVLQYLIVDQFSGDENQLTFRWHSLLYKLFSQIMEHPIKESYNSNEPDRVSLKSV